MNKLESISDEELVEKAALKPTINAPKMRISRIRSVSNKQQNININKGNKPRRKSVSL